MKRPCVQCKNFERGKLPNLKTCEIYEKLDIVDKTIALYEGVDDCLMYESKLPEKYDKKKQSRIFVAVEPSGDDVRDAFELCKKAIEKLSKKDQENVISKLVSSI